MADLLILGFCNKEFSKRLFWGYFLGWLLSDEFSVSIFGWAGVGDRGWGGRRGVGLGG